MANLDKVKNISSTPLSFYTLCFSYLFTTADELVLIIRVTECEYNLNREVFLKKAVGFFIGKYCVSHTMHTWISDKILHPIL